MRIFLTGASGMLAGDTVPELRRAGHEVVVTDLRPRSPDICGLDVTDAAAVRHAVEEAGPDIVFHFAAETNVDLCEKDPDHAFRVNTLGTENVALACQAGDLPMVYISTAGVFDGEKPTPYTEFDRPGPVNVYGASKLAGERAVRDLLHRFFIVRPGWMVGGWEIDKKFVYRIVCQVREGRREIRAVHDKVGTPTFTRDFARHIMTVVETGRYGLFHLTNKGTCSRYDMAVKIVEFLGRAAEVRVLPVSSAEFPLPAARPRSERMRNYKLDLLGLNTMPHWEESLAAYIRENKDKAP